MTDSEQASGLDEIIAKEQIRDLVLAYCRAIDRKDFELLSQLYHPGAGDEHGCNPSGTAQEFFEILPGMMEAAEVLQHNITNHFIKVDGEYAEGEGLPGRPYRGDYGQATICFPARGEIPGQV